MIYTNADVILTRSSHAGCERLRIEIC